LGQHIKLRLGILLVLTLIGTNLSAQNRVNDLDKFFSVLSRSQEFNGNVLVAENGKIIYEKSIGYADFPSKRLNTKNTLFPIASVTKTITATAILQQVEKGKLQLNDPAVKHLPDFPYPEITIRHLLSHTSGLPPYNAFFNSVKDANPDKIFTNADFIPGLVINKKPLVYQPGESWNYDNTNYIVLALILEKVSGESYSGYIKKHILQPAGMKHTVFFPYLFDSSKNKYKNLAIPHLFPHVYSIEPVRADSIAYISAYWHAYQFSGFGDFISTTHDLLKYDEALNAGKLLNEKLLNEAFTPVKLNNKDNNSANYGLGWVIEKDTSLGKAVYHSGGSIGLTCIFYRNLTKHQTVIAYDLARPAGNYLAGLVLKILNGQPVSYPKASLAKIYGRKLAAEGATAAEETLEKLRKDTATYHLNKDDFINLGYDFMGVINPYRLPVEPQDEKALEVFKLSIRLFPEYWNSYDSYGEILLKTGRKEEAIKMYQKSIELNPKNEGGKKVLEQLLKTDGQ
jgi:CubicO group peptidase (beta-lactamase class C family)